MDLRFSGERLPGRRGKIFRPDLELLPAINQFYQLDFIPSYIYEVYLNWIEGDLHKSGRSEKIAQRIMERLFTHLTTPVSLYKLAKESGLASHATIADYLDIMEKMFVLFDLNFRNQKLTLWAREKDFCAFLKLNIQIRLKARISRRCEKTKTKRNW